MHPVATRSVDCRRPALNIAVEVNHIVVPAGDKRASAELLARILGLEVEAEPGQLVRVRAGNGLTLDFSGPEACWAFQCAILLGRDEFDAALARISRGAINFYASCDRTGRGEVCCEDGARRIYFDDLNGHLFELIENLDPYANESCVKAVAIKLPS
jgi:catechol 2,3-dioxygenase-like lactoylglutathione lyase family enzyme